jgi:hypothetical protein
MASGTTPLAQGDYDFLYCGASTMVRWAHSPAPRIGSHQHQNVTLGRPCVQRATFAGIHAQTQDTSLFIGGLINCLQGSSAWSGPRPEATDQRPRTKDSVARYHLHSDCGRRDTRQTAPKGGRSVGARHRRPGQNIQARRQSRHEAIMFTCLTSVRGPCTFPLILLTAACGSPGSPGEKVGSASAASSSQPTVGGMHQSRFGTAMALLGEGSVLACGGTVGAGPALESRETYDPTTGSWSLTPPMSTGRLMPTATLLPNGKVLLCGGGTETCELFDKAANTWTSAPSMAIPRTDATSTLLLDGRVLMAGGDVGGTAQVFDHTTATWTSVGPITPRRGSTATRLGNGKVLVVGGTSSGIPTADVDLFDPSANTWLALPPLPSPRAEHTATRLRTGQVLLAGGTADGTTALSTALLYDETAAKWTTTGSLSAARTRHGAALMPSGELIVFCGSDASGSPAATTDVYHPQAGTFSPGPSLSEPRDRVGAAVLATGDALVAGGRRAGLAVPTSDLLRSSNPVWQPTANMLAQRSDHTATLLPDGRILVAGGGGPPSAELYDPLTDLWHAAGTMKDDRAGHTAFLLFTGKVLVVGGPYGTALPTAEVYDPKSDTWSSTAPLSVPRFNPTATVLSSGLVLVTGGRDGAYADLPNAEIYDPLLDKWTATASMSRGRIFHSATLLPSGKVLVAGGYSPGSVSDAELFDPVNQSWSPVPPMAAPRAFHSATVLSSGRVLVAGGFDSSAHVSLATAEQYDPSTTTWSKAAPMTTPRCWHRAAVLRNGKVLAVGGCVWSGNLCPSVATAEIYDPPTNSWAAAGQGTSVRAMMSVTPLGVDAVLVAGGSGGGGSILASADRLRFPSSGATAWQPVVQAPPGGQLPGSAVGLSGAGFRGDLASISGTASGAAADVPVISLLRAQDGYGPRWIAPFSFADGALQFTIPTDIAPGQHRVTVWVGGIPSGPQVLPILRGATGDPCKAGVECLSGFCVDGLCCQQMCPPCQSCATVGAKGVCTNIAHDTDDNEPPGACSGTKTCDGVGACMLRDGQPCGVNGACASGLCVDGVCCNDTCVLTCMRCTPGEGSCTTPVQCNLPDLNATPTCAGDLACDGKGSCKRALGQPCLQGGAAGCASGFCSDGVCCDRACDQPCDACAKVNGAPVDGWCAIVAAGATGTPSCSPYVCTGFGNLCGSLCNDDSACALSAWCRKTDHTCQPDLPTGWSCVSSGQCLSGWCADGVCCGSPCDGQCDVCATAAGASSDGTCTVVPAGSPGVPSCAPARCDGVSHECGTSCKTGVDCATTGWCPDGGGECHEEYVFSGRMTTSCWSHGCEVWVPTLSG